MKVAAQLLRDARTRAGLTQRELAKRALTSQSVIARIERGQTIPSVETLERLLHAARFELRLTIHPQQPLETRAADTERLLAVLEKRRVRYVLGGTPHDDAAGVARQEPLVEITVDRDPENLMRLATSLWELDARIWNADAPEGVEFEFTAQALANAERWSVVTSAGRVALVLASSGSDGS